MSDTSESDDGSSANWNRRRGNNKNNRKIVMRIEFDDSDETSASSGSSDEDPIRPSGSRQRPNRGLKRLLSSDDDDEQEEGNDSSSGNKITRKVVVRGRRMKRSVIVEDEPTDEPSTTVSIERTIRPAASEGQSASTAAGTEDAGFGSDSSNDEALEKCPICLLSLRNQEIGRPSICDHLFCAICIEEWAKNVTTCPIDRHAFDSIVVQESFNNRKFVREINVEPPKGAETAATSTAEDGLTFCQVCNLSNREEVMLLCDGCNQGYHMDCLNPPLLEIPEGFWYCDCCFESEEEDVQEDLNLLYEDLREMGVPETRLRIREVRQPRIPRTRQSERIRASIVARTRTSSSRITSEINISQPGSSSRVTTTTRTSRTSRTPVTRKRRTKVTRKRRKKRQRRTYVVEYDVDNYDEKFQIKTTKKYVRKRKTRKRRRAAAPTNDFAALRAMRASASAVANETFSLFGSSNGLDYFPDDESDSNQQNGENSESGLGSGGGASVQTSIRIRGFGPGSSLTRRKRIIRDLDQPRQVDILSSIMDMQDRFHNATRQNHIESVGIGTDGSLILPETPDKARTPKKADDGEKQVPAKDINQAPMYPRGGNHNYSNSGGGGGGGYNNRFNSQSNYRNSTGSSNSGGQFHGNSSGGGGGAGGSGGGGGSGGFLFNAFRRDNNNFQSDNNFTQSRNNNTDNSSPNLRGRFRQNQQNQQRRNQNRYSGPPAPQHQQQQNNTNINRCLIEPPTNPFNMFDNMGPPPASFGGPMQQPPPQIHQVPPQHQQAPPQLHQVPPQHQQAPPPRIQFNFNPTNTTDSLALPGGPLSSNFMMNSSNISPASSNSNALISIPIQALPPPQLPVYGPVNFSGPDPPYEEPKMPTASSITVPPLAPPPWNKNLFRLTSNYGDDDDDADCPNFSVYSAESFQVARSSENVDETSGGASVAATQNQTADSEKAQQEDEFEEKEEDLVQLGDDDDIPDAIESGNNNNSKEADESDIYEPENPTDEAVEDNGSEAEEDVDGENINEESHSPEKKEAEKSDDEDDNEEENEEQIVQEPENESTEKIENDDEDDEDSEATQDQKITTGVKKSHNKKGVLELYDDSDWEEWNIEKTESIPMPPEPQGKATSPRKEDDNKTPDDDDVKTPEPAAKNQTDSVSEEEGEERSYTPCLDEKTEHDEINDENGNRAKSKSKSVDPDKTEGEDRNEHSTAVIDGMETELISEEDEEMFSQDQNRAGGSSNKRDDKRKIEPGGNKRARREQFKKISKSTKDRNYRDKDNRMRPRKRSRSRSHSNDKENRHRQRNDKRRNNKRKDIERYDVRNVIGQPRSVKDRYGRDTSRPPRSKTRSKSRSPRRPRTKSRTRSASSKNERRSFSMSPTPVSLIRPSPRRRIFSPRRSRSRRRSRSFRRSPIIRRRSRTPLRLRSRSNSGVRQNGRRNQPRLRRRTISHSISRSRTPRLPSPRKQRSRSLSRPKNKPKRPKDRKKKRIKKRAASLSPLSPPPPKRMQRSTDRLGGMRKKKRQVRAKSPVQRTWSQTPDPATISAAPNESWTPPLVGNNSNNLTVILKNKELAAANKRKRDKKKRAERRREQNNRKEKRKQRSENRESPIAPSKEVFTSGDNILVSVSFNKESNMAPQQQTTVVTLPPTREEIVSKRRTPERPVRKQKKPKEKSQRRHKKTDAKPVAIIDLDRSPFQVINESPRDIIVLTDSDREEEEDDSNKRKNNNNSEGEPNEHITNDMQLDSIDKNANIERPETIEEESFEMQQLGPKTPPEPPTIKFSLAKTKQIKSRNPLHDEQEELQDEAAEEEQADSDTKAANKIGPNTPPESGPCSPDAYDPFDPTKSPSASPSQSTPPAQGDMPEDSTEKESHATESNAIEVRTTTNIQEKNLNPVDLVMALMTSKANKSQELLNLSAESASYSLSKSDASESLDISDDNNVVIPKSITVLSNVLLASGKSQQRSASIMTTSPPISKSQSQNQIKLPLPKVTTSSRQNGGTGGSSDDIGGGMNEIESPYSPGSDDYEDLFEPPIDNTMSLAQMARNRANKSKKAEMFDNLFGSSSPVGQARNYRKKGGNKSNKKASVKAGKKLDDDQIKIFDEVPSSAVDLQVKDKFLRKLNRQERVVEEVKLVLKPHYNKKRITKDDYKDILRRAVPKICHSRSGEINPNKIKNLIEAYVKKFRQRNKLGIMGTGQVSSAVKCAAYLKKL